MNQVWVWAIIAASGIAPDARLHLWKTLPVYRSPRIQVEEVKKRVLPVRKPSRTPRYVKGEVVVGYRPAQKAALQYQLSQMGYKVLEDNKTIHFLRLKLPPSLSVESAVQQLPSLPGITYAEPNYVYEALEFRELWSANRKDADAPADALFDIQYNLWAPDLTRVNKAWLLTKGSPAVKVAILDTGLSYRNAAIPGGEQHGGTVNGSYVAMIEGPKHVLIVPGADIVHGDDFPDAEAAHGNHVATIIAEQGHEYAYTRQNGKLAGGVTGIAPEVTIMPIKVLDYDGSGSLTGVADGIILATDQGADIINMSLGGPGSTTLQNAVQYAWNNGVLIVAACGNSSSSNCDYPAAYPEAMAVSAVDFGKNLASYSSYGPEVELAAPGGDDNNGNGEDLNGDGWNDMIWNIAFKETYTLWGTVSATYPESLALYGYAGTSMATPHVAAIAALVKSVNPSLTNADIRTLLQRTAQDIGAAGRDNQFGYGLVDAWAAVTQAASQLNRPYPVLDSIIPERTSTPWGVVWQRTGGTDTFWVPLPPLPSSPNLDYFSFWIRLKNYGASGTFQAKLLYASAASGASVDPAYSTATYSIPAGGTADGYFRIHIDDTVSINRRIFWFELAFSYDGGATWPDTLGYFFLPVGAPSVWLVYDDYTGMAINIDGTQYGLRNHPEWYETTVDRYFNNVNPDLHALPWYVGLMGSPTYGNAIYALTDLKTPEVVFWWMGADYLSGFSQGGGDTAALASYLQNGGDLFFSGDDYIYADYGSAASTLPASSFAATYLGLTQVTQDVHSCAAIGDQFSVSGVDGGPPKTSDLAYTLYCGGPGADSGWPAFYDDQIKSTGWTWSFQYQNNRYDAIRSSVLLAATSPSNRWVALFPLESQTPGAQSDSLTFRFLRWADVPLVTNYQGNVLLTAEQLPERGQRLHLISPVVLRHEGIRLLAPTTRQPLVIHLLDVAGREVVRRVVRPQSDGHVILPTHALPRGVYLLRVERAHTLLLNRKLVIQ